MSSPQDFYPRHSHRLAVQRGLRLIEGAKLRQMKQEEGAAWWPRRTQTGKVGWTHRLYAGRKLLKEVARPARLERATFGL